jgi:acyl-CoA thioester hydrolase
MFRHQLRVRYAEVDPQRVVFNSHWLTYFDDAMTRFLEHLGYDPKATFFDEGGFDIMLGRSTIEWHGSAGFDDVVDITVVPTRLGRASFDIAFTAHVDGRPVVSAVTTYVSVVHGHKRSTPIPDDVRAKLAAAVDMPA